MKYYIIFVVAILSLSVLLVSANGQINGSGHIMPASVTGQPTGNFQVLTPLKSTQKLDVLITLKMRNENQLNNFLSEIQDPSSPLCHKYLTAAQFDALYSPSELEYYEIVNYFLGKGFKVISYQDRLSIELIGTVSQFESVFNTQISYVKESGRIFYAPVKPVIYSGPYWNDILNIVGLNNEFKANLAPLFTTSSNGQLLYGSDLQVPYQLNKLYSKGYPTDKTVVTILWSGNDSSGNPVAPFVPSDISTYFNQTLPSNEPKPVVYGYPIDGAPAPGTSAENDQTQANFESTLDLEMVGSLAPGITEVEIYGPGPYENYLDAAFAAALNNGSSFAPLNNLVAISNSWGGQDTNDSTWMQYEEEAAARGITVLASSGDDGNTNSTAPSFPATMAYNNFGTLAVGGAEMTLSGTASQNGTGTTGIQSEAVWYNSPNAGDGSQGGVSSIFAEPSWQLNSPMANNAITSNSSVTGVSSGRGTPDVAADGANMSIYISYQGSSSYQELWGTSIASPLMAGTIAVMDYYLGSNEGFMNPEVYKLAQAEANGSYQNEKPFYFIYNGSNGAFHAENGYSLAVGWGSINAYNFVEIQSAGTPTSGSSVKYNVTFSETGLPTNTNWSVTFNGTAKSSSSNTISFSVPNGSYSFTIGTVTGYTATPSSGTVNVNGANVNQAISFTAISTVKKTYTVTFNEIGLPSGTSWSVTFNGSSQSSNTSSIAFTNIPNGSYSFTVSQVQGYTSSPSSGTVNVAGANISESINFSPASTNEILSQVNSTSISTYTLPEAEEFTVQSNGNANYVVLYLSGSGTVDFSIGTTLWGSNILSNTTVNVVSNQLWYNISIPLTAFSNGTDYYLNVYQASGSVQWGYTTSPSTNSIGYLQDYWYSGGTLSNDNSYPDIYTIGYYGTTSTATTYSVTFTESGLPSSTTWSVTFNGKTESSTSSIVFSGITDGTYPYSIGPITGYTSTPSSGNVTINGANQQIQISFSSTSSGTSLSYVISYVNSTSISTYSLPEAEEFSTGSTNLQINYVVLYLSGSGSIVFSIGTTLWGSNVLSNVTVNVVSGKVWYNVSIPTVTLGSNSDYFLNVYQVSGSVSWGYTSSPSSGSKNYVQDYWYSGGTLYNDNSYPDIYAIGYSSLAVLTSSTTNLSHLTGWEMVIPFEAKIIAVSCDIIH